MNRTGYKALLEHIPHGKENAISRRELRERTGMTDRKMRAAIATARADGEFIINNQDGRGYYMTDDLMELKEFYDSNHARAINIMVADRKLRQYLKLNGVEVR